MSLPIVDRPDWRASSPRRHHGTLFLAPSSTKTVTIHFAEFAGHSRIAKQTSHQAGRGRGYKTRTQTGGGLIPIRLLHETGVAA